MTGNGTPQTQIEVNLKQTNGTFEAKGTVFGMQKDNAFKEMTNKSNHLQRMMNIGLKIADGEVMFLALNGSEGADVYFSKANKGGKPETKSVPWDQRFRNQGEGFKLIGVGLALQKEEGSTKNEEVKTYTPFDAIERIHEDVEDGTSVFVRGKIEYGSYKDETSGETRKTIKYVPTGMYLTSAEIDFSDEKFEKQAEFAQHLIFNGVRREEDKTFSLDFGIVGYKSYEENTIPVSEEVAIKLRDNVKPYTAITVTGELKTTQVVETTVQEVWGEESNVGKIKSSGRTVMFVTGARPATIDKETYEKRVLDQYVDYVEGLKLEKQNKSKDFESQEKSSWGKDKSAVVEDAW